MSKPGKKMQSVLWQTVIKTIKQIQFNMILSNIKSPEPLHVTTSLKSFAILDDKGNYLNSMRLFYAYFCKVPNLKTISNVDCTRIRKWLATERPDNIIHTHSCEQYCRIKKQMSYKYSMYLMKNELLLTLETDTAEVVYADGNGHLAQALFDTLKRFTKREKRTTDINMIISGTYHLGTMPVKIKMPRLNISTHYNDNLEPLHKDILNNLKKKNTKGLYLFHGVPGTGKSTYIRYLIHQLKKKVIFMSPAQAAGLEDSKFSLFLIENKNAVIVIEDAEELVVSRDSKSISGISILLNLSDGLLAESLGIQVIASFNTNITNVDKALLRKGRLTALYEFKELSIIRSAGLMETLGFKNYKITRPMTLADIYNVKELSFEMKTQRNAIGFMTNNN